MSTIGEESLDCLICALSTDDHFSKEPITLSGCSHSVCKGCLIKENKTEIKCGRCEVVTERDLRNDKESIQTNRLIKLSLADLYKVIEERMGDLLDKINVTIQQKNDRVEVLVNNIQEEIEIRVESLKCQLGDTFEKIKSDLTIIKEDLKESEDKVFERKLNELRYDISKKYTHNKVMFYDYQENCIRMNEKLRQLKDSLFQFEFKPSSAWINGKSLIGELSYVNKSKDIKAVNNLRTELLNYDGCNTAKATFRYTLMGLSKVKENRENIFSPACKIRDLDWNIRLKYNEKGNKTLGFYVACKSDKYLNDKSTIRANVEYRLLHQTDTLKNLVKEEVNSDDFCINGDSWGYREFIKYEDLMKPEKGYYNAIDDSITVEVVVTTDGDVKDTQ